VGDCEDKIFCFYTLSRGSNLRCALPSFIFYFFA